MRRALNMGVPVFGWGSGAALLGRAMGAGVHLQENALPSQALQISAEASTTLECPRDLLQRLVLKEVLLAREVTTLPRGAKALVRAAALPVLFRGAGYWGYAGVALPPFLLELFLTEARLHPERRPADPLDAMGGEAALRAVLRDFYTRARHDQVLGPVFTAHVHDWDAHIDRVQDFWVTALSGIPRYQGNLNVAHAHLGIRAEHLTRWLSLFEAACGEGLAPGHAALLTARAEAMGRVLRAKQSRERLTKS
ncbi:truncated hemoglobin [Deinococcus peraridilitoris DSM 19664]|uniref:Truncated hemoglobin n=2 Tax=Deinococcus TaxID=1298 RepID=K9ZW04_DEIPD|nr:truncated hemoglobin [Deinococcus peraridilitoris DSM 19664]